MVLGGGGGATFLFLNLGLGLNLGLTCRLRKLFKLVFLAPPPGSRSGEVL